jgi:predicted amidohydrolase
MTTIIARLSNQLADMQQIVLFPEVVGAQYQPLDRRKTEETAPASEAGEATLSFQQALDAGQLLLFA